MHVVEVDHIEEVIAPEEEMVQPHLNCVATQVSTYGSMVVTPLKLPTVNWPNSYGVGPVMLPAQSTSNSYLNLCNCLVTVTFGNLFAGGFVLIIVLSVSFGGVFSLD